MFTGLVQSIGVVAARFPTAAGERIVLRTPWSHDPAKGDSICVSGCCLTVVNAARLAASAEESSLHLEFDAIPETLAKTTLGTLAPGSRVNLEHSATPTTLLGGHVVQGHVEGVASVAEVFTRDEWRLRIKVGPELLEYLTPKGSVCVEGVSLTVAAVDPVHATFDIALIPTTLELTTLGDLKPGARCNIETDIFARTVIHWLKHFGPAR